MFAVPLYSLQLFDRVLGSGSVETLVLLSLIPGLALFTLGLFEMVRTRSASARTAGWTRSLNPHDSEALLSVRQITWFVKHPACGLVSVGFGETATEDVSYVDVVIESDRAAVRPHRPGRGFVTGLSNCAGNVPGG